jgi:hypothetical protein
MNTQPIDIRFNLFRSADNKISLRPIVSVTHLQSTYLIVVGDSRMQDVYVHNDKSVVFFQPSDLADGLLQFVAQERGTLNAIVHLVRNNVAETEVNKIWNDLKSRHPVTQA